MERYEGSLLQPNMRQCSPRSCVSLTLQCLLVRSMPGSGVKRRRSPRLLSEHWLRRSAQRTDSGQVTTWRLWRACTVSNEAGAHDAGVPSKTLSVMATHGVVRHPKPQQLLDCSRACCSS